MTTPPPAAQPEDGPGHEDAPKPKRRRVTVEPEAGGRLEQLLVAGKKAKDEATVAGEKADEMKAAIKAFLLELYPEGGAPDFDIPADPQGRYPAYTMSLRGGWRLDTEAMKAEAPEVYVKYAVKAKPSYELRESTRKQGRRRA